MGAWASLLGGGGAPLSGGALVDHFVFLWCLFHFWAGGGGSVVPLLRVQVVPLQCVQVVPLLSRFVSLYVSSLLFFFWGEVHGFTGALAVFLLSVFFLVGVGTR